MRDLKMNTKFAPSPPPPKKKPIYFLEAILKHLEMLSFCKSIYYIP